MSSAERLLYMIVLSTFVYLLVLVLGYLWARALHYPFTLRQRKMWNYYVMFISAIPVLGPLMVAMGLWFLPVDVSIETCVSLLVVWAVIAFFLVRRMSKPGGRLSQEQ